MAKKDAVATLLTTEKVAENFMIVNKELDKFDAISKAVSITDDESLAIAENNAGQIRTLLTRTEAARKALKEPYFQTVKTVDAYAKTISDRLDAYKQRMALAITGWRDVQEAHERANLAKKQEELAEIEAKKTIEANRLVRLTNTIYARLYGGTYKTKSGEKYSDGCHDTADCRQLVTVLTKSFPPETDFHFFPDRRNKVLAEGLKAIKKHNVNLIDLDSNTPGVVTAAKKRIHEEKMAAGLAVEKTEETLNKKIAQETKKGISEKEKDIKAASKGTRKILKVRVVNEEKVTREFLSVDGAKVKAWMEGQTADIKAQLMQGHQPLQGIEFYIETIHVAK